MTFERLMCRALLRKQETGSLMDVLSSRPLHNLTAFQADESIRTSTYSRLDPPETCSHSMAPDYYLDFRYPVACAYFSGVFYGGK